MAKKPPSKEIRNHWDRISQMGCMISGRPNATIHHIHGGSVTAVAGLKGVGLKANNWLVIPLDAEFHTGKQGIDSGMGVQTWEKKFGKQVDFLDSLSVQLGINLWKRAGIDREVPGTQ